MPGIGTLQSKTTHSKESISCVYFVANRQKLWHSKNVHSGFFKAWYWNDLAFSRQYIVDGWLILHGLLIL